jgi:hypothetical protein
MKSTLLTALSFVSLFGSVQVQAQHSVAREWNELLIAAIRKDFARPTVHARNLFHTSAAMYDAWAAYDDTARPFLLGDTVGGFACPFIGVAVPPDVEAAREEAISYATYRLLIHRFQNSPGKTVSYARFDSLMLALGYDKNYVAADYANGTPADLGNYIAQCYIAFGLQDGSNEGGTPPYSNLYYAPRNPTIIPIVPGNPDIDDPNLWQPITLNVFIDQSGNVIPLSTPPFLSPEWGNVTPFSLKEADKAIYTRDGDNYIVYHDPGPPPLLDTLNQGGLSAEYQWTFALVAVWSGHHDPSDGVSIDISPASVGNNTWYPTSFADHHNFYNLLDGGDPGQGHDLNPATGLPYTPQIVPRGDFTRVLTEFWADGLASETPPGHWFTILNYVGDHPLFEKRWMGQGPLVDDLEWDVKTYFTLGGSVHDVAVSVWGIKGWYDYVRPLSAIRYMCDQGQSSDSLLPHYSANGIPLIPGHIELVDSLDPLVGPAYENLWKVKLYAWKAYDSIADPDSNFAGAGWILGENFWPWQRETFVTPPFAGYPSGHSAFSRAAAEVMTLITGDPYFPGGMGEFHATAHEYFEHEDGPSVDVTLQWATYRDASDQCSLSRIWGGIHPPADDIASRYIGMAIGPEAFDHAETYFDGVRPQVVNVTSSIDCVSDDDTGMASFQLTISFSEEMDTAVNPVVSFPNDDVSGSIDINLSGCGWNSNTEFSAAFDVADIEETYAGVDVRVSAAKDAVGNEMEPFDAIDVFAIDTRNPEVVAVIPSFATITDDQIGTGSFHLQVIFDEAMDSTQAVDVTFPNEDPLAETLLPNASAWVSDHVFVNIYDVLNSHETLLNIDVEVSGAHDDCGNALAPDSRADVFSIALTPSGLSELGEATVRVYPNPVNTSDLLTVDLSTFVPGTSVALFDTQGRMVEARTMNSRVETIDLGAVSSGLYVIRVVSAAGQTSVMLEITR